VGLHSFYVALALYAAPRAIWKNRRCTFACPSTQTGVGQRLYDVVSPRYEDEYESIREMTEDYGWQRQSPPRRALG